jgi:hypothetical protein
MEDGRMSTDRRTIEIPLEFERRPDPHDEWIRRALAWEAPRLPGLRRGIPRRWGGAATWQPADTALLSRHRSDDGQRTIVTLDRVPPPGFRLEYDLGALHGHQLPGTKRLMAGPDDRWLLTGIDGDTTPEYQHLGWVEQAAFPMLEPLTLAHDPVTGRAVLVGGGSDPLTGRVEPRQHLGWLESFPVLPRSVEAPPLALGIAVLRRQVDRDGWRHRYVAAEADGVGEGVAIGGLLLAAGPETVELRQEERGRVVSELLPGPSGTGSRAAATVRWTIAPLTWSEGPLPKAWAARAAVGRGRRAVRGFGAPGLAATPLGHARREAVPGWAPLYSGTHPVTADQMLSPSQSELRDLGYVVDGILGYVSEGFVDSPDALGAPEVPWGSRFGQGRRV